MTLNAELDGKPVRLEVPATELLALVIRTPELRQAMGRLTRKDLAEHYKVSLRTVDNWMKDQLIPFFRIGDNIRFDLFDVDAAVRRNHLLDSK